MGEKETEDLVANFTGKLKVQEWHCEASDSNAGTEWDSEQL